MPDNTHTPSRAEVLKALGQLQDITLGEMDAVKLLNRIDTKYLTDSETLLGILSDAAQKGYRALKTDGVKLCPYDSVYYDTEGLKMFLDHHNRRLTRQKVRTREYVSSGLTFLEIKRKNNHGRTKKKRMEIPSGCFRDFRGNAAAREFLCAKSDFTADELQPTLETGFRRITLVNRDMTERLTIDTELSFKNLRSGVESGLKDAVVIELKQDGRSASEMKGILLDRRVKPVRISKYCIGVTLTFPGIKSNRFKVKIRTIEKTIKDKLIITAPLMIPIDEIGNFSLADEDVFDVSAITDAMMTTAQSLTELAIRFLLNLAVCWILVQCFYYRKSRRRDYYFTFMVFSSAMLLLLYMMGNAEVGVGLTLGLFAIFGVIRYRTETVPIREMTYLFVIIAMAAVNGLAPLYKVAGATGNNPHYVLNGGAVGVLALSNALVVLLVCVLESERLIKHTSAKLVLYDRIDLIVPERRAELIEDLEKRVGVVVDNLEVGHVDLLKDAAFIKVYYTLDKGRSATIDTLTKAKDFTE